MIKNPKETKASKKGWEQLIDDQFAPKSNGDTRTVSDDKKPDFDPNAFVQDVFNYKRPGDEKKIGDSGLDNFREGLQQGAKSLATGFGYAVGEGLDRIGADKMGERVKKGATIEARETYDPDDSWGQFLGSLIPSVVPTAAAIGLAPFTGGGSVLGAASIGGLSVSSAGNGMMEYEAYKKEKGQEVDENAKLAVGVAYGVAEGLFERFQLGKLMPNVGKNLLKGNVKAAEKAGRDVLEAYKKANPQRYNALMSKVKDGLTTEGLEEVGTEIAQAGTQLIYQEREDRKETLQNLPKQLGMAMLGGSIMGAGLGPLSYGSQNLSNQKRRQANGGVTLVQSKEDGEAYELLGINPGAKDQPPTYSALDKNGNPVVLAEEEIGDMAQLSVDQFDKLLQDKLDTQEVELFNMQPKTLATYGEQQVEVVGEAEKEGKVYITLPDGSQKSVFEEELEDITMVSPEEQYIGEGKEIVDQPKEPVEAIRDKQQVIETAEGDFLYPGDEGYDDAMQSQQQQAQEVQEKVENTRGVTFGKGNKAKRANLVPADDGSYDVLTFTEVGENAEPVERPITQLTETEIEDYAKQLNKVLDGKGMQVLVEPTDSDDPLSPSQIRVYKKDSEAVQQKRLDEYQIKADGAKVSVVNTKTGSKVGSGSKFYLPKIKQYFSENAPGYSQMERIGDDPNVTEQNYLSEVASRSENPVEIAEAYQLAVQNAESSDRGSTKTMAIARALKNNPNLSRKQLEGRGLDKIYKGIAYANYAASESAPSTETMGLDELSEILTDQTGQEVTIDDIMEFIQDNPGGPSPVLNEKDSDVESLEEAFREVTGAEISPALAQSITESNLENQTQRDTQPEEDSALESEFDNVADEDLPNTGAQNFTAEIAEIEQQLRDEGVTDEEIESIKQEADELSREEIEALESEAEGDTQPQVTEVTDEFETETTPVEEEAEEVPGESEVTEGGTEVTEKERRRNIVKAVNLEGKTVREALLENGYVEHEGVLFHPSIPQEVIDDIEPSVLSEIRSEGVQFVRHGDQEGMHGELVSMTDSNGDTVYGMKLHEALFSAGKPRLNHVLLHETGHIIWESKLTDLQKDQISDIEVKSNYANTIGDRSQASSQEENFAEQYASSKTAELLGETLLSESEIDESVAEVYLQESTGQPGGTNVVDDVEEVASEEGEVTGEGTSIDSSPDSVLQDYLEQYEADFDYTVQELVDDVEALNDDIASEELTSAVAAYREEQRADRELAGRNDMDSAEEAFVDSVQSYLRNQAPEQGSPSSPDPVAGSDTSRSEQLKAKEQTIDDELSDLFDEFDKVSRGQANIGLDPKLITISSKIIAKGVEKGFVKIQQFANWVIKNKGADFWRRIFPNFKAAYSANLSMQGNPNDEDLNAIAKSTAEDYISDETESTPSDAQSTESITETTEDVGSDVKQPWQMTAQEYSDSIGAEGYWAETSANSTHVELVRKAYNSGKDVPERVLNQYPQITDPDYKGFELTESNDREYSSTQVNIEGETAQQAIEFAESIPENELYTDGSGQFGAETEPHVTALYGLTADNADTVRDLLKGFGPVELTLGKTSLFENEDYDVLKVDIDSPDLVRINKLLRDNVEYENDFPDYQPHLTLAYLKPGEGAKYAGDTQFEGETITLDELLFSGKDRTKTPISLISEEQTQSGQPSLFDSQETTPDDSRVRRTKLPEPKDGWREGLLKARKYAIELGIKPTKEDGSSKSLKELVDEVDAFLGEETTEPSTPKARAEISHGLKQDGQTAFEQLSTFIDLKNLPDGYHQKYGEKGDAIMPLTIEKQPMFVRTKDTLVDPDAYYLIVEQWGIQNGDIMSDPRVDFLVYPNLGLAFPYSFTNSYAGVYQEFVKNGFLSHEMAGTVDFLEDSWVPHITGSGLLDRPSGQQETESETNELTGEEQLFVSALGKELEAGNQLNKTKLEDLAQRMGVVEGDKRIKELAEYAIILRARELADIDSTESAYQAMVELYENQPNLTARTSESIKKQQYSTPAPIAYLMGVYTNLHNGVAGFEPSAGNGLLTIAAGKNPSNVRVNEIDSDRLEMLRLQSFFDITQQDGTEVFPYDKSQQAIVTNPPFGATDARYQAEVMGRDIELSKLEHVMAARALDTMRDDGKAAILIGGNDSFNDKGNRTGQDRSFFHFLHHYYNVDEVLNFGGNVFNKQGANFPTRVILINGRKDTPEGHAPMNTEGVNVITDLATLYEQVQPYLTEANNEPILQSELDAGRPASEPVSDTGSEESGDNESGATATVPGGRPDATDQPGGESTGADSGDTGAVTGGVRGDGSQNPDVDTDGQRPDGDQVSGTQTDGQAQRPESEGNNEGRTPRDLPREKSKLDHRLSADDIINNEGGNVVYSPLSDSESITTEMPASMAFSMVKSLNALADEVGNVDAYVMEKVGFESVDQLYDALAGEQVDAVALAIYQAERGKSVVVGDQTGIGKGRVAATMIRYAKQRGIIPVFWTEKPKLFSDIHRDLKDIGVDYRPFIVNARDKGFIVDDKGKVVYRAGKRSAQNRVFKNPELVSEFDYVALTYSQIQSTSATTKRDFVRSIAPNALIIMDESHNASGQSNTGEYLMEVLNESQGAVYLSATFAKRPDNMPVYAIKTDISDVAMNQDEMVEAIERGGVALQEIISSDLVKSGQMVRRQRSFKGVKRSFEVMGVDDKGKPDALGKKQRQLYDDVSEIMRNIIDFQATHVTPVLSDMADDLNDYGITEGTDKAGVDNQPFVSRIHHIVDMLLFSVKADAVADRAIEVAQSGRKPIIAIKSTMESVLDDVIATGETVEDLHFGLVLTRALDSVMKYRVTDGISGDKEYDRLSVADLTSTGQKAYERITEKALDITAELKGSPIDYIVNKIEEAGFSIGEVTGRSRKVVYDENGRAKAVNRKKEEKDKNILFNGFNSGELDMLMINSSGATGASAHSSEKFKDTRQRVMIIHQPELNINTEVQKWGRIFRTGQVNLPEYQYITSAIPAELRLMMVLKKKIKSLDANTTSSQKTSSDFMDTSDFINKYGDEIVTGWFRENPDMQQKLQKPIKDEDWSKVKDGSLTRVENLAMKVTGRMAFMPSDVQESFYEEISQSYDNYIDALNEMGENELVMDNVDLQAETLDKKVIVKGKKPGTPFGGHTYLEKVKAKTLRKPLKADEIEAQVKSELDGQEPQQYRDDLFAKAKRFYKNREADQIKAVRESDRDADEKKERIAEIEQQTADEIKRLDKKSLHFIPGQVYIVPADAKGESGVTTNGVFLGYGINTSAANPYSASAIKIRFAVNSSQRTMTVPTSFNGFINAIKAETPHLSSYAKNAILKDWDSNLDTSGFETRYIVTGNVLQGLSKSGNKGQLIQYTTNDGSVKNGVLLSANIKEKELADMDSVRIEAKEVEPLVFNLGNGEKLDMSASTGIRRTWGGEYQLFVPSSKVRGSRYYLDDTLLDMVEDNNFVKKGNEMRATVPIQNMGRVLEYLSNEHSIYADVSRSDLDRVTEGDGPMFRRSDQGTPISDNTEKIASHLENLVSDWKSKDRITVARTFEELPYMVQRFIESEGGGISGTYLDGKVYINAYEHSDIESAERTLLHETVGHLGFRGLLENMSANRDQYNQLYADLTLSIYDAFKNDAEFQRISNKYRFDFRYNRDRMEAAEEFIAHMAERGDQAKGFVDKFIQLIKDALAAMGFRTKLSRADLIDLVTDMRRFVDSDFSVYNDGHIMRAAYKRDVSQPFFSELEQVLQSKLSGKGTAKSYKEQIEGFERKGDFRKAEIEWVGLYEWLDEQTGKLNREDVVGFVRDNNVRMEEIMKGAEPKEISDEAFRMAETALNDLGYTLDQDMDGGYSILESDTDDVVEYDDLPDEAKEYVTLMSDYLEEDGMPKGDETKYGSYTLPGGMDYKEMLITLPGESVDLVQIANDLGFGPIESSQEYVQLPDDVQGQVQEEAVKRNRDRNKYTNSHWNEPNVLAHVRFNTREGNMLFMEEIQSDLHQEGRKKGYKPTQEEINSAKKAREDYKEYQQKLYEKYGTVKYGNLISEDELAELKRLSQNLDIDTERGKPNAVPNFPFKTTWHELVIKRMIRYAAENGFQKVGWAPGEVHNERYDLSKQVNRVSIHPTRNGLKNFDEFQLVIEGKDGMELPDYARSGKKVDLSELEDTVGKEVAKNLVEGSRLRNEGVSRYEDVTWYDSRPQDLSVGGEGMKGFYDKILPRYLNKYLKKWDSNLGVETLALSDGKTQDIWSFSVTPDMMRSVLGEGQPMFKKEDTDPNEPAYRQSAIRRWISEIGGNPLQQRPHQYQKMFDGLLRSTQNMFVDGKRIQEGVVAEGGKVTDKSNFVQDEENHYGRIENLRTEVENNFRKPIIEQMQQLHEEKQVKYKDLRDYLYAMHAPERNADLYERNPDRGEAQSGMSDKEANEILRKLEQRGIKADLEEVAKNVYQWNKHTLRMQYISGMISKERFGGLWNKYDYYVPLRGFEELVDIDPTMYSFDRRMEGRESKAGDILSYVQAMSDTAIINGETNRVKQSFLEFVKENHERSDLFRIRNVYWRKTDEIDEETGKQKWVATFTQPTPEELLDGRVKRRLDPEKEQQLWDESSNIFEESTIKVQVDGRPVIVEVTKPHLARAFGKMDVEHMPKFLSATASMMNWLRNVITQYSPEFGLRNIIRDSWTGMINIAIDQNITQAAKVVNPVAYAGAFKALRNYYRNGEFDNSDWGKALKSYMKHGAVTGYWQLNQVKDHTKNLQKAIERGAFGKGRDGVKALGHFLDDYNRVLENIARVSAFKHLTQDKVTNPDTGKPYTNKQAANYARNLTVNFNRKGNSGGAIGTLYLFFNATVQGITRQVQPFFSEHTRIRNRAMAAPVVMGAGAFMFAELMRVGLGKDDDEEWRYDKINDFTRKHNIILPNWFSDDPEDYLRVPLPYGYNVYWAAGDVANRFANGSTNVFDSAIEMAAATIDAYNPIGTSSGETIGEASYKSLLPTIAKPGFELVTNTDFAGNKIKPEPFPFAVEDPKSQQHYQYVAGWAKETAQWLNRVTGGDEFTEGTIDISPEHIEYIANFFGGGPARFIDGLAQTGGNVVDHVTGLEELELYDIYDVPFVRSFYGKVSRSKTREQFLENQMKVKGLVEDLESYYASGQTEKARAFREEHDTMIGLFNDLKAIEKQKRLYNKMLDFYYNEKKDQDDASVRDKIKNVVESQHELYLEFNRMVNEAKGRAGRKSPTQKVLEALQ